ncbi:MAG: ferredoxin--NADP reductase, partial [Pseudomonadota bacterium]
MTEQTPVNETTAVKATPTLPDAQIVTQVQHYTDRLFS